MDVKDRILSVLAVVLLVVVALFTMVGIVLLALSMWVLNLPAKVGRQVRFDNHLRYIFYSLVSRDDLKTVRDDYMNVIQSKAKYTDELERWGLLREIDSTRDQAIGELRRGEKLIAAFCGISAIVLGNIFGIGAAGVILTVGTLFYAVAVSLQVLIVDVLAYSRSQSRGKPIRELAKMKAWNEGPLRGTGGMGVVFVGLITSTGDFGRRVGMDVFDTIGDLFIKYDEEKWRDDENN